MGRICEICKKGYMKGNLVPRGIGRRVTKRTIMRQQPNLRIKRLILSDGNRQKVKVCASCVKRLRKDGAFDHEKKVQDKTQAK